MILDQFRLDGKVAMVTGGTRGLGAAMTIALAEAGADVAIVARDLTDNQTEQRVRQLGRRCLALRADLAVIDERVGLVGHLRR